jgi:8-oxo-dGTP diphosphatase
VPTGLARPVAAVYTGGMTQLVDKVYAYITNRERLLLFAHPEAPEAGLQVPGGTMESGETPAAAVLREAVEETGLAELELVAFLGVVERDMGEFGRDETHRRHYYHLRCPGAPPNTWRAYEMTPSEGPPGPIPLDFFWVSLVDGLPPLSAGMDEMTARLLGNREWD